MGACSRYFITQLMSDWLGKDFPFGTLLVNITGSFLLGLLYAMFEHEWLNAFPWRELIGIGMLGALTTFSTFSIDTLLLLQQGAWGKAILNMILNLGCCLLMAWLGMQVIKGN